MGVPLRLASTGSVTAKPKPMTASAQRIFEISCFMGILLAGTDLLVKTKMIRIAKRIIFRVFLDGSGSPSSFRYQSKGWNTASPD